MYEINETDFVGQDIKSIVDTHGDVVLTSNRYNNVYLNFDIFVHDIRRIIKDGEHYTVIMQSKDEHEHGLNHEMSLHHVNSIIVECVYWSSF